MLRSYVPQAPSSVQPAPEPPAIPDHAAAPLSPEGPASSTPYLDAAEGEVEASGRRGLGPATKEEAIERRRYDLRVVDQILERARRLSPNSEGEDMLLRNSVEWIDEGMCELVVLSRTDERHQRRQRGDEVAWFDDRVVWPDRGGDYDLESDDGIFRSKGAVGEFVAAREQMLLFGPGSINPGSVESTLIHEIQHDADDSDKHGRWADGLQDDPSVRDEASGREWNHYASELRAYWISHDPDTPFPPATDPAFQTQVEAVNARGDRRSVQTGFANARQQAIFFFLAPTVADGVYFRRGEGWVTPTAYLPHYYVFDPEFRAMVDGLVGPSGGNSINSVRIERLAQAIEYGDWEVIEAAAGELDRADRAFLADRTLSAPFWDWWAAELSGGDLERIEAWIRSEG